MSPGGTRKFLAEREGFEPPIPFRVYRFSRPTVSTAHTPLRVTVMNKFTSSRKSPLDVAENRLSIVSSYQNIRRISNLALLKLCLDCKSFSLKTFLEGQDRARKLFRSAGCECSSEIVDASVEERPEILLNSSPLHGVVDNGSCDRLKFRIVLPVNSILSAIKLFFLNIQELLNAMFAAFFHAGFFPRLLANNCCCDGSNKADHCYDDWDGALIARSCRAMAL